MVRWVGGNSNELVFQSVLTYLEFVVDETERQEVARIVPLLLETFDSESDRGVVLVISTMVERELESHIELRLQPKVESSDELMSQGGMSPIGSFSAKINLAFRIGLITEPERFIFHQLRAIRNRCAHEIDAQTFDANHFRDRMKNMIDASPRLWEAMRSRVRPPRVDSQALNSVDEYLDAIGWRPLFELFFALIVAHKRATYARIPRVTRLSDATTIQS